MKQQMARRTSQPARTAAEFLPKRLNLKSLREAAAGCRGCDLYRKATQTVFGEGPRRARMILVGEMAGDEEDREGKPFVGPAGRLLDRALADAGVSRNKVYVTNAVKHFRWEPRGKRRLHKKPSARQIEACQPWLQAELLVIQPPVIVCLGATAAQALLGRDFRITKDRGRFIKSDQFEWPAELMATHHPSAVLRAPDDEDRRRKRLELADDLRHASEHVAAAAHG